LQKKSALGVALPKGFFRKSRNNDMISYDLISVTTPNGFEELTPQCRPAAPKKTFSTKKYALPRINGKRLSTTPHKKSSVHKKRLITP
jgi:hypothetical protein